MLIKILQTMLIRKQTLFTTIIKLQNYLYQISFTVINQFSLEKLLIQWRRKGYGGCGAQWVAIKPFKGKYWQIWLIIS